MAFKCKVSWDHVEYLKQVQHDSGLGSITEALNKIVVEHKLNVNTSHHRAIQGQINEGCKV